MVVLAVLFPAPGCWQRLIFSCILGILLGTGRGLRKEDRDKLDDTDVSPDSLLRRDPPWLELDLCLFLVPSGQVRLASDLRRFLCSAVAGHSKACRTFLSKIFR